MDSGYASVSVEVRPLIDHVEKVQTGWRPQTPIVGNKDVSQSVDFKSNSSFNKPGKRKRQCEVSRCSATSAISLLKNYNNFMRSGLLSRLLYRQDGEWLDFPKEVTELVRKKFQMKYAIVEVELDDSRFILDVMYMKKLDISTGMQKPIAWIDDAGSCFFPEIYDGCVETQGICQCDSHEKSAAQDINLHLQIEFNGVKADRVDENVGELRAFKKIRVGQSPNGYHNDSGSSDGTEAGNSGLVGVCDSIMNGSFANLDNSSPKINSSTEFLCLYNDVDFTKVHEMFSAGMGHFSCPTVIGIKGCSSKPLENRLELFKKLVKHTEKLRGSSNVQYAWLPCSRKDVSSIMANDLGLGGLPSSSAYGYGVHLSSKNYAYTSVKNCDDDENGVRHMLLCRVVLGNVEPVHLGSDQFCPSSDRFDTGVDNILDPRVHVVWEVNALTHIYPEYVVSFKLTSDREGAFDAQARTAEVRNQLQFGLSNESGLSYHHGKHFKNEYQERATTFGSSSPKTPKSPWMPFPLLFEAISKKVPPKTMHVVYYHYNLFKCKKSIVRSEFIRRLRMAVGDTLLKSTITSLQCKQPTSGFTNLKVLKPEADT